MSDLYATDASTCGAKQCVQTKNQRRAGTVLQSRPAAGPGAPPPRALWTFVEKLLSFTSALFATIRGSLSSLQVFRRRRRRRPAVSSGNARERAGRCAGRLRAGPPAHHSEGTTESVSV